MSQTPRDLSGQQRGLPEGQGAGAPQRACDADPAPRTQAEAAQEGTRMLDPPPLSSRSTAGVPGMDDGFERAGQRIGPYVLLQPLGEGGFGAVWMAEQREPVRRQVALKLIKAGMDTREFVARFEAERQALAMMDHPHIARVFDAGATLQGRPYFVMELVRGLPIVEFCDHERLDMGQRLNLFTAVCQAVQHAHHKGVIHRDLKPSNVLVAMHDGKPLPKVIDFGIAKASSGALTDKTLFTEHGRMIGTPAYMSPEQAEAGSLDIDTRSDIYSLGVLLYELLTGTTPTDAQALRSKGYVEMLRIIREQEPPRPSARLSTLGAAASTTAQRRQLDPRQLRLQLRGDLDWIVMKCLEKDRGRRYDSCAALAEDIARHLRHEPVLAGPPGARYRIGKFVRRHRAQVASAALLLLALIGGLLGTGWGLLEARRESARAQLAEAEARRRASELAELAAFQADQLGAIRATLMGEALRDAILADPRISDDDSRREPLTDALASVSFTDVALKALDTQLFASAESTLEQRFGSQPLLRAALLQSLSDARTGVGLVGQAEAGQRLALQIREQQLGDRHTDTLASRSALGMLLLRLGRHPDAAELLEAVHAARRVQLGEAHPDTLESLHNLAWLARMRGERSEAEALGRQALELRQHVLGHRHPHTLLTLDNLGVVLMDAGRIVEAEPLLTEALAARRETLGSGHLETLYSVNNVAWMLLSARRVGEARALLDEGIESATLALGERHPHTLLMRQNRALALRQLGEPEAALAEAERVAADRLVALGPRHPQVLQSQGLRIELLAELGDDRALDRELAALRAGARGDDGGAHPMLLDTLNNLGIQRARQQRWDAAEALYAEVLAALEQRHGPDSPRLVTALNNLGATQRDRGDFASATTTLQRAVDLAERQLGPTHPSTLWVGHHHMRLLRDSGALQIAAETGERLLALANESLGSGHWQHAVYQGHHALTLSRLGRHDEALALTEAALASVQSGLPAHDPNRALIEQAANEIRAVAVDQ